ncbi:cyanophycinase [Myxococcota bacterium]|nr:cyanophycinase [Myxococcota bacterium]
MPPSREPTPGHRGFVIPIGGAEDKVSARAILRRFVKLAGGRQARLAVIPTASQQSSTGDRYRDVFRDLGAGDVDVLDYRDRGDTERSDWLESLDESTGVFMTGGNQLRLSTILGGTPVASHVRRLNARGVHVAGTSAGAAFVSEHMIAFGREGATPIAGQVTLAPGLGLTNRVIVDQHFRQRDRLGRLMTALAYNPFAIGVGLDEDTAAFLGPDNRVEVVGSGAITIVDVSGLEYSSMATAREGRPVQLVGVRLHVLAHGAHFDLETRRATPGPEDADR